MPWRGCYKKQVSKKVLEQMLLRDLRTEAWKCPSWSHSDSPRSCCMASKPNHLLWKGVRLLQGKQHLPVPKSLQVLKPIRIFLPSSRGPWLEYSQLRSGVRSRTKTSRNPHLPSSKALAKPCLTAVMSTGTSTAPAMLPLELQVSLLGC